MISAETINCTQISRPENFADQFGNIVNELECSLPQSGFGASFWLQVAAALATIVTVAIAAYQAKQAKESAEKAQEFVETEARNISLRDAALVAAWEEPTFFIKRKGADMPATAPSIGVENNSSTPIFNIMLFHESVAGGVYEIPMLMPGEVEWHDLTKLSKDYTYHHTAQPLVFQFENHLGEKFKRDATDGWRVVRMK